MTNNTEKSQDILSMTSEYSKITPQNLVQTQTYMMDIVQINKMIS